MALTPGELATVLAVANEIDCLVEAFMPLAGSDLPGDVYASTLLQLGRRVRALTQLRAPTQLGKHLNAVDS